MMKTPIFLFALTEKQVDIVFNLVYFVHWYILGLK